MGSTATPASALPSSPALSASKHHLGVGGKKEQGVAHTCVSVWNTLLDCFIYKDPYCGGFLFFS